MDCRLLLTLSSGDCASAEGQRIIWGDVAILTVCKALLIPYLSHASMGMSQLDHHGEVRGCELKDTRGNHSLLLSEHCHGEALGCLFCRKVHSECCQGSP